MYTYVGAEQFKRATSAALRGKKMVTPLQIDILFALFDTDGQLLCLRCTCFSSYTNRLLYF